LIGILKKKLQGMAVSSFSGDIFAFGARHHPNVKGVLNPAQY